MQEIIKLIFLKKVFFVKKDLLASKKVATYIFNGL